jgi:Putative Actinobacterial Holin-X, holin superfamily III
MVKEAPTVHPYELRARSAKALLQRFFRDASTLVEQEVDLAKAEAAQRGGIAVVAARSFALALTFGFIALACVCACAIAALAAVVPLWAGALIVGCVCGIAAFVLKTVAWRTLTVATAPALSKLNAILTPVKGGATLEERHARIDWTRRQLDQTIAALEQKTDLIVPMRDTAMGLGSIGIALSAIVRNSNTA